MYLLYNKVIDNMYHKFYKKHLKGLPKFEGISICSFCKNQVPSFRYLITWKRTYNIWKLSETLNLLFSKTTQGNSLKFFTMVLTNQDLLILI